MTEEKTTRLRERMIEEMRIRGMGDKAQQGHIRAIKDFAIFLGRSPDQRRCRDGRLPLEGHRIKNGDTGRRSCGWPPTSSFAASCSMCCPTVSTASAITACSPVRAARPRSQRSALCSERKRPNKMVRQALRRSHPERAMPRLRWPDAHHRDLPTRPETQSPGATEKAGRMTRRPSHCPKPTRKHPAFRGRTPLRSITLSTAKPSNSTGTRPSNLLPINASHTLGSALLLLSAPPKSTTEARGPRFSHRSHPASAASSFQGLSTRAAYATRCCRGGTIGAGPLLCARSPTGVGLPNR